MTLWADISRVAMGVNVLALLVLCAVWAQNYRQFRSKHTLGLLVFALMLLGENALGLYYFLVDPTLTGWFSGIPDIAATALMALRLLETLAIGFLLWVTLD